MCMNICRTEISHGAKTLLVVGPTTTYVNRNILLFKQKMELRQGAANALKLTNITSNIHVFDVTTRLKCAAIIMDADLKCIGNIGKVGNASTNDQYFSYVKQYQTMEYSKRIWRGSTFRMRLARHQTKNGLCILEGLRLTKSLV